MSEENYQEEPTENGLFCFINESRACGGDCMAYTTHPSESPVLGAQQKNCLLLITGDRIGRGVQWLVQLKRKSKEDQERSNVPKPLDPRGGMQ